MADFPGSWPGLGGMGVDFSAVTGISVETKGYFFKGTQLWEYDPAQDTWSRKKDRPAGSGYSFAFAVANRIYMGSSVSPFVPDSVMLWEYDIANNDWSRKKNLPIQPRIAPFGFSVNNTGFVGGGQVSIGANMNAHDFWRYDASNDTWTRLADFPGPWTIGISGFSIGSQAFVYDAGLGFPQAPTNGHGEGRLWQYDIAGNTWIEKAKNPGGAGAMSAVVFAINNKAYVAVGVSRNPPEPKNDFWVYDPSTNSWAQRTDVGGGVRWFGSGFAIGEKGYVGLGTGNTVFQQKNDFWQYTPE